MFLGCQQLKVPPEARSSGLIFVLGEAFQEDAEMLREHGRGKSFLAFEVVIECALRNGDRRGYVPNADMRIAKTLKEQGG